MCYDLCSLKNRGRVESSSMSASVGAVSGCLFVLGHMSEWKGACGTILHL